VESKLVDWAHINSSNTTLEQGRSSYNTTENWVELTNANIGLYFAPVFDQVYLSLDESEAGNLTWNGSVNNSWTTAANWTPNATPSDNSIVYIPDAATTPNDPTLNPTVLLGSLNIDAGGILNAGTNISFTINNGPGAWLNYGSFNPGSSTVIFTNPVATMSGSTTFNNVTINSGAGLRPLTDNVMSIAGAFVNNGTLTAGIIENTIVFTGTNQTLPLPNGALTAYHHLVISGTGAVVPTSLNLLGNLTLNQAVDFTGKTVSLIGTQLQVIGGTYASTFNNLMINNTFGQVDLSNNATVSGILTLTAGNLNIANNTLTLGVPAVAGTFNATHMIIASGTGELRRPFTTTGSYTFPIGDNAGITEYSPITISVDSGSFSSAYIGVSVTDAVHPNNYSLDNNISRYWKVNQSGITAAVATITATYAATDILGAESDIAAAQLKGTFNQQTNPWIRYSALGSNTLSVAATTLTAGQTAAFTGIKGGPFSVVLSGFGSFCLNNAATLTAEITGGDAPYTYLWSEGLGTLQTATPPTSSVGTINYTATVKDANGITVSDNNNVVVLQNSVGGTVSSNQAICSASTPADLTLTGQTGSVIYWQSATDSGFTAPVNIANTTTTLPGASMGLLTTTTYFRAVVLNGTCANVYSSVAAITINSTTWTGSWSNGLPSSTASVIISANYTPAASFECCSLTVNNNAVVLIPSGTNVTLNGALTVVSGSSFTLQNNANLIQTTNTPNSGNITVLRNSAPIKRLDHTLWCSPVTGTQTLQQFSPNTLSNRFYVYNILNNTYTTTPATGYFLLAKAIAVRAPNNWPTVESAWGGSFTGIPNNGNITTPLENTGAAYNGIGNPYPSTISGTELVNANSTMITGTLYFYAHTLAMDAATGLFPPGTNYAVWNPGTGGTPATVGGGGTGSSPITPNGIIQTGQGFLVKATAQGNMIFTNSMRKTNSANPFFKQSALKSNTAEPDIERHRIWLNLSSSTGALNTILVGYAAGATSGIDYGYDGLKFGNSGSEVYSVIAGDAYSIQGKALPFVADDTVQLGFKAAESGTFTIAIYKTDGLFTGNQDILIKDNLTGTTKSIKTEPYNFTSAIGTFDGRFEIVYTKGSLGIDPQTETENSVMVYTKSNTLFVQSSSVISAVRIFDMQGRLLSENKNINDRRFQRDKSSFTRQVVLVEVTDNENKKAVKKIIL
jgi:hypothetical protein